MICYLKRVGVLALLLLLLVPSTVFPHSGDGDIPEIKPSPCIGNDDLTFFELYVEGTDRSDWDLIWDLIIEALSLLP